MRYRALLMLFVLLALASAMPAQSALVARPAAVAPSVASYQIEATLDPIAKTVAGAERITYTNPSSDTLNEIWLRLYLRAFRDANTTWMREYGRWSAATLPPDRVGDISLEHLALADGTDLLASATLTDTLLRVPLPQPLLPGQSLELDATWISKLPRVFARTGYGGRADSFFMVGQWYPKMAVYDRGRWDTEPWHANAEFFHDFGSYDVRVTVPQSYVVAGVGVPSSETNNPDGTRTLRFTADDVTDFAFAASPEFLTRMVKSSGVGIALYYMPEHGAAADAYLGVAAEALQLYGSWYGAYPYPRLTIVDVPDDATAAGGMEYPTLVTSEVGGSASSTSWLAYITAHEIGHQWWPMQTATDEAAEPWLDEGLTEYTGIRYMADSQRGWTASGAVAFEQSLYAPRAGLSATLPAWRYTDGQYSVVYAKPALGLWTLEGVIGPERFRQAMAAYLSEYRFKHPSGADFRAVLERELGGLGWLFDDYLSSGGMIDYAVGKLEHSDIASTVLIVRKGVVRVPIEILITFRSGAQQLQTWDGQAPSLELAFAGRNTVVRAEVDPFRKLKAELNRLDNSVGVWQVRVPMWMA
ncbi:MAG TPA: M1 family metallopeptidase [Roseiflexaceae bacterium]|nr:M1 family metallopeptidase [Roseiflexaceae bacterium]